MRASLSTSGGPCRAGWSRAPTSHTCQAVFNPIRRQIAAKERKQKDSNAHYATENLKSTSLYIIGPDASLTDALATSLAARLGYSYVSSSRILKGLHQVDHVSQLAKDKGWDYVADEEATVLKNLADQVRCCTSTLPSGAVRRRPTSHRCLAGGISILVRDLSAGQLDEVTGVMYPPAEITVVIQPSPGFNASPLSLEQKVRRTSDGVVLQLVQHLQREDSVLDAKAEFREGGFHGEPPLWPCLVAKV